MFLTGTLLNVATVLAGVAIGLLVGSRMPARIREGLTTGLGFFTLLLAVSTGLQVFTDPAAGPGDNLAVMAAVLAGVGIGDVMDPVTILAIASAGGVILLGVAFRLLDLRQVRVASFLPALVLAPVFIRVAAAVRDGIGG